jgi:hypothetical protein
MTTARKGNFVEVDGLIAVVVATDEDENVPGGHLAVWFGEPPTSRKSDGGSGGVSPEVWTVPAEYCLPVDRIVFRH